MYRIKLTNIKPKNVYVELIDIFLRPDEYVCLVDEDGDLAGNTEFEFDLEFNGENYNNHKNFFCFALNLKNAIFDKINAPF